MTSEENKDVTQDWKDWIAENVSNNVAVYKLRERMEEHAFIPESVRLALPREPGVVSVSYTTWAQRIPEILRNNGARHIDTEEKMQLFELEDFLTVHECDKLVEIINKSLRPSTITVGHEDKGFRTSRTCDLTHLNDPFVVEVEHKLALTIGIQLGFSEGLQGQKYKVGQEFKEHTDCFTLRTEEFRQHTNKDLGQRTWTFMVYLNGTGSNNNNNNEEKDLSKSIENEGEAEQQKQKQILKGGATHFVNLKNGKIFPKKGKAIIWNNLHSDGTPNLNTLHCGSPVEAGEKFIITKWFRARGIGPALFDI
eukprot:m.7129 g.7129  ORF g.7129 m.7129 type:complete len:309 (-) comp3649_c0_seq1:44-970(-)